MARHILSRSQFRQMRKSKVKHEGHKVITDDVKKLKSLAIEDAEALENPNNFYREPVEIEYYIPKESRFQVDIKWLYIRLVDPKPLNDNQKMIFKYFEEKDRIFDVIEVMNTWPQYLMTILDSYENRMPMLETLSRALKAGQNGDVGELKRSLYIVESLRPYEPTLCALKILGDYVTLSMNQLIRKLNEAGEEFSLEDETIAYLIKLHEMYEEENNLEHNERFQILVELFFQQAFPNRGATSLEDLLI